MRNSVKIQGTKETARFFEKILKDKQDRKEEIRNKIKSGKLQLS